MFGLKFHTVSAYSLRFLKHQSWLFQLDPYSSYWHHWQLVSQYRRWFDKCHSVYWLKKVFDTLDHEILLSKLELYGFKGASLNLFRDYLSDRTQVTVISNINSETSFISCGVPQGSILGPLLFLLYINDLPNCNLLSDVRMYADDTNLTFASKDPNELFSSLTHDLGNLKQWLDSNRLSLNVLKTKKGLNAVTTGSSDDGLRFKITSCACAIVKAFKRECRRAPVHDLNKLAFTSSSQRKVKEVSI